MPAAVLQWEGQPHRFRAAKACLRCNQRRVKCDALENGLPCTRCRQNDVQDCELIQSNRGTYSRKKARLLSQAKTAAATAVSNTEKEIPVKVATSSNSIPECESLLHHAAHEGQGRQAALGPSCDDCSVETSRSSGSQDAAVYRSSDGRDPASSVSSAAGNMPGNPATQELASPEAYLSATDASSYREISWAAMFDHFLDGRRHEHRDKIDKCSITYLGESFPLAMVLDEFHEGERPRLHHPGPPLPENNEPPTETQEHPAHMLPEDIAFLQAKEVFVCPGTNVLDALVATFLDRVYPIYPVVNRQEFLMQYRTKRIPWILMHSLCFVAATFCPLATLHRAGFTGRRQARSSFYRKAKALFDTGYESCKVTMLQSVIFMTFWGGGPNNYWNFYSWIGTGVTIAETIGVHRSMATTDMKPQDRSLLKRLWWTLVVRDASCGTLVGRPFRINLDHADTEMLSLEDFEYDAQSPEFASNPLSRLFGHYQIQISKLSLILREIIAVRFQPTRSGNTLLNLQCTLHDWYEALPPGLKWSDNMTNANPLSSSLFMAYNHHLILTTMSSSTSKAKDANARRASSVSQASVSHEVAENAAQQISSLSCSIIRKSDALVMPHEAFQALFLAEAVFYSQMDRSNSVVAQLGRTAVDNCQMVWHDIREAWDPAPWIMKLFDNLLGNLQGMNSHSSPITDKADGIGRSQQPAANTVGSGSISEWINESNGLDLQRGVPNSIDPWQTHPVLGIFDMPQDGPLQDPNPADFYSSFSAYFDTSEPVGEFY